jgi:hypothetical protein
MGKVDVASDLHQGRVRAPQALILPLWMAWSTLSRRRVKGLWIPQAWVLRGPFILFSYDWLVDGCYGRILG